MTIRLGARWYAVGLIAIAVGVFAPVWQHDFVNFDDPLYVLDNPIVAGGFSWPGIVQAVTTIQAGYWLPLTWLSHMADVELFGMAPGPHHLVNLLLHIFSTLLLFGVMSRMTGERGRAAFVAAIFAVHPLRVESVAWVAERKDVLSTLFWMLAVWAYVEYVHKPGRGRYLAALGLFALGLLAKPMVLTLPIVLCLLDVWPLQRLGGWEAGRRGGGKAERRGGRAAKAVAEAGPSPPMGVLALLREKIPFAILSVLAAIVTFVAQREGGAVKGLDLFPIDHRLANALVSCVAYLGKMVWPSGLAAFYPHQVPLPAWQVVGAAGVLVAISWLAFRAAPRFPYLTVGWLWYVVTLAPVIGLVQAGEQAMADRFTYVPHIGLSIALAWGVADLFARWRGRQVALTAAAVAVVLLCAVVARAQVFYWRDSATLWRRTLDGTTGNYMAHNNLGVALAEQGRFDEALAEHLEAIRLRPGFAEAHNSIGSLLARRGDYPAALAQIREALRLKPTLADAHNNLGAVLARQGAVDAAVAHYSEALRLFPEFAAAHHNLGRALDSQGRRGDAEAHYREALRIKPRFAEAHYSLGALLAGTGRADEAVAHLREALKIVPGHSMARAALARLMPNGRE